MKEGIAPSKLLSFIPPGMVSVLVLLHPSSETTDDPSKLARLLFREGVLFDLPLRASNEGLLPFDRLRVPS